MAVYINAMEAISPQNTFNTDIFPQDLRPPENGYFSCIQPVYKEYIKPKLLRRMSQVIRRGVTAGTQCLKKAKIDVPDAIVIGTSLGCVQDTVKFLNQLDENNEQLLPPTAFIQSTHNTVSGQIALLIGCKNYNLTYSQRTLSFENALMDAFLLLQEQNKKNVLLGGIDEITEESFSFIQKTGCARKTMGDSILNSNENGYIPGEGASFFSLSNEKSDQNLTEIRHLSVLPSPENQEHVVQFINDQIKATNLTPEDIDAVITGANGDINNDSFYRNVLNETCPKATRIAYKHLVGEYDTASGFAVWLGSMILDRQEIPTDTILTPGSHERLNNVLLLNQHKGRDISSIFLSGC